MPTWYRVVQAARYLKVPPWDLAQQPIYWVNIAEAASQAEAEQQKKASKQPKK